jgi:zinc transport system ATP-binding protein
VTIALPTISAAVTPLVSLADLRVERGGRPVLAGVTADIPRGGITAVVGLNGSGKSTLLRTLLGEFPYRGTITYRCGHDHRRPRPEHVGYVPQKLTFDAHLPITVRDLLGLALNRYRPGMFGYGRRVEERMRGALRKVDAAHLLDVPVEGLSGGQLQRVLLALAVEPQPELLLLDEPTAGIDFRDVDQFYDRIAALNQDTGLTVVLVSHDLPTVRRVAGRVLCLRDGVAHSQGTPADVLTPETVAVTFGTAARGMKGG